MTKNLKKSDLQGFTIIEVMIVLAVAAMILLIVLLAVPALQRNSRNTAIKNDAASVAAGINTYESDQNGIPPDTITSSSGTVTVGNTGAVCGTGSLTTKEDIKVQGSTNVTCSGTAPSSAPDPGNIVVVPKKDCKDQPSTRAFAIYYSIETSGGTSQQCVDS
ncbi:MAG TPA: prepilin-type N-terminal cleavage/methylation domain-containing protein [Candidatus Saccharimonadales bacterium]|nr:prepilin-type N-terminal cleavage/methylation domain-containing protein [Candidatus Saccharimonadales bacterium]